MTMLDEISAEISYAIENFVHSLEGYLVISQPLLSYVWRITPHNIKSPVVFALRLIKKHFREFEFPVEETFGLGKGKRSSDSLFVFRVSLAVVVSNYCASIQSCFVLRVFVAKILADPHVEQSFEWSKCIEASFLGQP